MQFNLYTILFVLAIAGLAVFFIAFRKKIGEKPEIGFLAVALICGTLLSFSEPKDYVNWDEKIHYKHAEKLASNVVPNMAFRPNTPPVSFSLSEQKKNDLEVDRRYKEPSTKSSKEKLTYSRIGYIPSAIIIAVGNLIHLPFHITFTLGRWMNLLVYSLIIYFAIKKLKSGKMILAVIALLPTAIFLASNYNYDSWVTAFTMLGLAYLFSELQQPEKKISTRDLMIMIGAFIIGLGPKAIYFPLMLLLFFLKPSKFKSPKQYKIFIWASAFAIVLVVSSFMAPFLIGGPGDGDQRGGDGVNSAGQVHFILTQPVAYAKILTNFMVGYVNPLNASSAVVSFAYMGSIGGFFLILLMLAAVTFTNKDEYDKLTSGWKIKTSTVAIFLATVALISSALYVAFTPVESLTIGGVQGRYLIPLLFPLLFVVGSSRIKNPFNKNIYNTVVFIIFAAVLLKGIWDLAIKLYH